MKDISNISRANKFLLHIIGWILYLIYVYLLNLLTNKQVGLLSVVVSLIPFIGLFYVLLSLLKYAKKSIVKAFFLILMSFTLFSGFAYLLLLKILPYFGVILTTNSFSTQAFLQTIIVEFIKFFTYALLYFIIKELLEREKRILKIKEERHVLELQKKEQELQNLDLVQSELLAQKEKMQYQYAFLRSQINPHFLFNTLNVLFSQALPLSEDLSNNIMKLSDVMRYSLENVENENMMVPLQKEIDNLLILIEIHHLRFSNSKHIDYQFKGEITDHSIPPLSIITIVENAFKYGDLSDPAFPLKIVIEAYPNLLNILCVNKKKKNNVEILSHHIGLDNLSKRLDFSFHDKYQINIDNTEEFYTFQLLIRQ